VCVCVCVCVCVHSGSLLVHLTHTHTHNRFMATLRFVLDNLGELAPERQNQESKTNLDLLEQQIVTGSGISLAICKSAS